LDLPFLVGTSSALPRKEEPFALALEGGVEVDSAFGDLIPCVWIESSHDEANEKAKKRRSEAVEEELGTQYSLRSM
jgi:hypothetical protein